MCTLKIQHVEMRSKKLINCHLTDTCETEMYVHALTHVKALYFIER